jgi:hypothetical protein
MLPVIAEERLADYIDVFCDQGFFTPEERLNFYAQLFDSLTNYEPDDSVRAQYIREICQFCSDEFDDYHYFISRKQHITYKISHIYISLLGLIAHQGKKCFFYFDKLNLWVLYTF